LNGAGLLSAETFLWGLQSICQIQRIPFVPDLVLQQHPPPHTLECFNDAARALGSSSRLFAVSWAGISKLPLPFMIILREPVSRESENPPGKAAEPYLHLALLLKMGDGQAEIQDPLHHAPRRISMSDLRSKYSGRVVLLGSDRELLRTADHDEPQRPEFGFCWFVPELLRHKAVWRDVLLASLAIQVMALAVPICTQVIIDKVIVNQTINTLYVIAAALLIFVAFSAALSWLRQYLVLHAGNRIDAVLGRQVFHHLLQLPLRYFEHRPTGTLVARIHGVETIRDFLSSAAVTLMLDVPFLFLFLAIMYVYNVTLTAVTVGLLCAIVVLSAMITPMLRQRINRQFLAGARNQAFLTEYVAGMETVKSLQLEPQLDARFKAYLSDYLRASLQTRQLGNTYSVLANALEQTLMLTILCLGAWIVMTGTSMTIGMLVAFQMFASRLAGPVMRMVGLWQEFQQAAVAVRRLGDVMNAPAEPYSSIARVDSRGKGELEIRSLSFRHSEKTPYLYENLNLKVEAGQCVAITGPSGSGKSTLAKLLQGFYMPDTGEILVNGQDIRNLPANELRLNFGVVPQETMLFSGTIYENIAGARPLADVEDVVRACEQAGIHSCIEGLPDGYQTRIGEHGCGLSGGQKQRLSIARALLKNPGILIFDEALNGLDPEASEQLAETINQLRGQSTILFIGHAVPGVLHCDQAVSLGAGNVQTSHATRRR